MSWEQLPSSYDAVAIEYEARFLDELDGKPGDRALLRAFAESAVDPVADLGCGPGQIGAYIRGSGRTVIGADISREMTTLAAARLDAATVADLRALPFNDASFGGVVAFYSLIHLPAGQVIEALAELHRILRPGGQVLLSVHEGDGVIEQHEFLGREVPFVATLFTMDELTADIRSTGLQVVETRRRDPYPSEHQTVRLYVRARRPS